MMPPEAWQAVGVSVAALLGGGGPLAIWLSLRTKNGGTKVPKAEATQAKAEIAVQESGIERRWREYADQMQERYDKRFADQDTKIATLETKQREAWDMIIAQRDYIFMLRRHIFEGRKPPPPDPTSPLLADFARPSDQK